MKNYESSIITTKKASYLLATYTLDLDEPIFAMNLVGSHKNMMLLVSFSCVEKNGRDWRERIETVLGYIKIGAIE